MFVSLVFAVSAAHALHSQVRVSESKQEYVTEGQVVVHAPPAAVYATLTDYRRWPQLFSDVSQVRDVSGKEATALVRFTSRLLAHEHTLRFDNQSPRTLRFYLTDGHMGTKLSGDFRLLPADNGHATHVRMRLLLKTSGVFGWFVRDDSLRQKRQRKIQADLIDLKRYFESPKRSVANADH